MLVNRNNPLPLRLQDHGEGCTSLLLGDLDITGVVAADGLSIEYEGELGPVVTIKFVPRGVSLDLDIALLRTLLEAAERSL